MVTVPQPSLAEATPVAFVRVSPGHWRTRLPGSVRDGGVVSRTVIVWTQALVLPQESTAVQRREITLVPPQALVTVSLKLTTTEPQLSWPAAVPVAVGAVLAPHSSVTSGGQVMVGGV